jgi:transposase-like protein
MLLDSFCSSIKRLHNWPGGFGSTGDTHVFYVMPIGIHFIDQQRYHCPTCGQSFAWKSTLNKHMLTHSVGPLPRYRCDLCSKEYAAATQVQVNVAKQLSFVY